MENLVKITVTSDLGHEEFSLVPKEALKYLEKLENEQAKWTYIDGRRVNIDTITEEDLIRAEKIESMLTHAGGSDAYVLNTEIKNMDNHIELYFNESTRNIHINLNEKYIFPISKNIDQISNYLDYLFAKLAIEKLNFVAAKYGKGQISALFPPKTGWHIVENENDKIDVDIIINFDFSQNELKFIYNPARQYVIMHILEYIVAGLKNKVKEFVSNEIEDMRKLVNIKRG